MDRAANTHTKLQCCKRVIVSLCVSTWIHRARSGHTVAFVYVLYRVLFVCAVAVPPGNPIIEARDEVLSEGNETEMTCTAMSSKPAAAIRWMKGDKELPGRSAPHTRRKPRPSIKTFPLSA